jgi:NSS family neurotransmitter:Na+ symporter
MATGNERGSFGGALGFILAAAGSAVGLGNLWKFPYLCYRTGGGTGAEGTGAGAFVLSYIAAVLLLGIPVMLAEIILGRRSRQGPVGAFKALALGKRWHWVGILGVTTGFVLLSYYSVVAGWTGEYLFQAASGTFGSITPEGANTLFSAFLANPGKQVGWLVVIMGVTMLIVAGGVSAGIERMSKIMMPALLLMLLGLLALALTLPGGGQALAYLFRPDFTNFGMSTVLDAMGQAFFSLSLGMGAIITYGSYVEKRELVITSAFSIAIIDTLVALMASVVIFSILFSFNTTMEGSGISNIFTAIPILFAKLPGGSVTVVIFYLLVVLAAITSTISLLEVVVSHFIDRRGWPRRKAVLVLGGAITLLGIPSALSFNLLADYTLFGKTFFDLADYLCANWALPLGGLFTALFAGWILARHHKTEELGTGPFFRYWQFTVRFVSPLLIVGIMVWILFAA